MAKNDELFIIHHQQPVAHIRVWHEAIALDASTRYETFNYENAEGKIETITFEVTHCFFAGITVSNDDADKKLAKLMTDARHWYVAYLEWEDQQFDSMGNEE